jgi:competence ComEA-like helix-hairpin-helix protein
MSWRDIFCFSRSERITLALLFVLSFMTGILLQTRRLPFSAKEPALAARPETPGETTVERIKRLASPFRQPGRVRKFAAGTVVEINAADTAMLKRIPGIGSVFASRIVRYRNMLGGFHTVAQLKEVFGIDADKYLELEPWFTVDTSAVRTLPVNTIPADSLRNHPYITRRQASAIERLRKQKKRLSGWENLQSLNEFSEIDRKRLLPYLSFE